MPRTLLALYGELQAAEGAASELAKRIRGAEVSVLTGQPRAEDGAALAGLGVPEGDRAVCEQCLRLGASVVVARVADREADGASEVLERFEPEDLDSLGERFRLDDGAQRDEPMPMRAAGPPAPAAPTPAGPPPTAASAVEERRAEAPVLVTAAGNWLFMPAEWEFVETGEELEVGKAARVVEEVAVLPDGEIRRTRR